MNYKSKYKMQKDINSCIRNSKMKFGKRVSKILLFLLISLILIALVFSGRLVKIEETKAVPTFQMQTGYYVGTGATHSITGLGFKPDLVIIKADTAVGAGVFKTSSMPAPNTAYFTATADDTTSQVILDSNGFTLGALAAVNAINVRYTYIAFGGSNCSANGDFCVGLYIGDGISPRKIVTGFQPDLVLVKRSGFSANWRSSAMPTNVGQFFDAAVQNTAGALFTTLDSDGFNVGLTNNANLGVYYYIAFRNVTGKINTGSFIGNGVDDRNIDGVGFMPNWVFIKNANVAIAGVYNVTESNGDYSSFFTPVVNGINHIQELRSDGFQVGSSPNVNGAGNTIYWAAFGGTPAPTSSGTFLMARGSYTGTGSSFSISGLGFAPDLVIIKHHDQAVDQFAVFRTRIMPGNTTAFFANPAVNFAGGITALGSDGFTIGTHSTVNTLGDTYYWTAFGNAWNPNTNSGSANFVIGAYTGNGLDNRNILRAPFQPDIVAIKSSVANVGVWRTSQMTGDFSVFFSATAGAVNFIQRINSDGFQIGTDASVNTAGVLYHWFAFKSGLDFNVNNYIGSGSPQNITIVGFQPDLLWVKSSTLAIQGVLRTSVQPGNAAQPFTNVATIVGAITGLLPTGFSVGTAVETNSNMNLYSYAAWRIPDTIPPTITQVTPVPTPTNDNTPNYTFSSTEAGTISYGGSCSSTTVSAIAGNNTITFNPLPDGTYSNCTINVTDIAGNISNTLTVNTFVVDTISPATPIATPGAGTYTSAQNISLSSNGSSYIRYRTDNIDPTCLIGSLYTGPITVSSSITIKAIGCDDAGNFSPVATFVYTIDIPPPAPGGGGGYIPPPSPPPPQVARDFSITIKEGEKVRKRTITLLFSGITNVSYVIISENSAFIKPFFVNYRNEINYTLSEQPGEKTLYIKFRSPAGGETSVYTKKVVLLTDQIEPSIKPKEEIKKEEPPVVKVQPVKFTRNLKLGMVGEDVKELQKFLNNNNFILTTKGPGSPGKETTYFGTLTQQALIRFQKANNISPAIGYFGPKTRNIINKLLMADS